MSSQPNVESLFSTGRKHFANKAYAKSLEAWKAAQKLYHQSKQKREEGIVGIYISQALKALGQNKEALVSATQAVRILRDINDPISLRRALVAMAHLLYALDYVEEAGRAFSQAAEKQSEDGPDKEQVQLLMEAGAALARVGRLRQSQLQYAEAIRLAKIIGETELQADALADQAQVLLRLGETQQAHMTFQTLAQLSTKVAKPALRAYAFLGLAEIDLVQGKVHDAETIVRQAQETLHKAGDITGEAMTYYYLGRITFQKDQLKDALKFAERASRTFKQQGKKPWLAKSQLLTAQILKDLDQKREALQLYDQAIELFSNTKEKAQGMWARVEKGKALLCFGQERAAEKEFTQALRYYRNLKNTEQEVRIYLEVAECMNQQGKYNEAREQCILAIEQLKNLQTEEWEIQAYQILLKVTQGRARYAEDLPLFQEGLKRAKAQDKPLLAVSISVILAQLTIDSDSPDKAISILKEATGDNRLPLEQRAEANLQLGLALMKQRKFAEAVEPLQEAIAHIDSKQKHNKAIAYYQLSEALKQLKQKPQRQDALEGAIANLPPGIDDKLQALVSLELAPLIAQKDTERAIHFYEQSRKFFEI
ncbi:MAG: tetratricopeptide repeat protein, partial [Promethearchaeota archaeon]